ncbi:ESX-1 secretion-associated protein [Actinopolyspora mortivallis]|uniref:ESX-1 secretion-associated protein n=1 Tax=Actinopolyspora mortivallis TaxID=33906 RepID=UPI00036BE5FA|nr:ESX-1 secretion-associated protein [Actinopolyspora mortivallis]
MSEQVHVTPEELRAHASTVDEVVDRLNTAVDASQQVSLDNDAYGILCRPFAWMLDPVEQHGIDTLKKAVEGMRETAENLRDAAGTYESVDKDNSDMLGEIRT